MTLSSVMFYTGENPYTGEKVYVARSQEEKRRQKSYFFRPGQEEKRPGKTRPRAAQGAGARRTPTGGPLCAGKRDVGHGKTVAPRGKGRKP